MGQIFLKDKDGLTRGFTIKGDAPSPSEQTKINSILTGQPVQQPQAPVDNTGIMSAFASGVGAGWNQMQAGTEGLMGLAAEKLSPEGRVAGMTPDQWDALRQQDQAEGEQYYAPQGGIEDQDGLYGKTRFLAYQLGQSAPSTIGGVAGAIAGSALGPVGAVGGFMAGAGLGGAASLPQNYEQNIEEQEGTGKEINKGKAFTGAVVQSALEGVADRATLGVAGLAGKAVPASAKALIEGATKSAWTKAAAKVGESTLMGISTEGATEAVQQAVQRWQADKPLGDAEAQHEYLENAIVGGLLGGVTGGAFGTVGATLDLRDKAKADLIQKDLDATDTVGDYRTQNAAARKARASYAVDQEDEIGDGANRPLLEDLRPGQDLLSGPNAVTRPARANATDIQEDANAVGPVEGKITPQQAPKPLYSPQEYSDAIVAMRGETLVSPDKIKNKMKIGRTKAQAIFNAMLENTDARKAGSKGQYLTVVDNSTSGNVNEETQAKTVNEAAPKVTRKYEVRPIANEDVAPFQIRRAADTKVVGPSFKTSEEAFNFADSHPNIGDYSVVQNTSPAQHGVYEVTSGIAGQRPTSRFVRAFNTSQEAIDHVNSLNPALSPESNQAKQQSERDARIDAKQNEEVNRYRDNLQALADHILGPGRSFVELSDALEAPNGQGLDTGDVIEGMTENDPNSAIQRLKVAYDIFQPGKSPDEMQHAINSVGHHEFVHIMKNAGLFTPKEWKSLVDRANTRVAGKPYTYVERAQVRTKGAPEGAGLDEEAVAEMVRDYMRDPSKFTTDTRSLLRRMFDFVRTVGNYSRALARGNNVLGDIASGKIGERESMPERAKMYGPYYSSVKIPGFFLKSAKYFEGIAEKNPDQSYPGNQWIGMLNPSKTGVKDEELKWLGLKDWLKDQKKVSVKDILQYIGANSLDVKEAMSGDLFSPVHENTKQMGGKDYTELFFHMPHLQPEFSVTGHFDGFPNILAHGRFNTRTVGDKKTLFIEEMQSDLHQQARKHGYTSEQDARQMNELRNEWDTTKQQYRSLMDKYAGVDWPDIPVSDQQNLIDLQRQQRFLSEQLDALQKISQIPDAPFKTNWHELIVKRLVKHAVDTGHEAIAWNAEPDGVAQSEQYGELFESKDDAGNPTYETQYGNDVSGIVNFYTRRLTNDIKKLFNKPDYGNAVPHIVPRVDASGADLNLEELFPTPDDFHMVMQEVASYNHNGEPAFVKALKKASQIVRQQRNFDPMDALNKAGIPIGRFVDDFNAIFPEYAMDNTTSATVDKHGNPNLARWQLDITPELKATAEGEGFPMFSSVRKTPAPDTPEFRSWFGGSKVAGEDDKPITVYHGTTRDFDRFSKGKAHPKGYFGKGFYFTDTPEDADANYAGVGPDLYEKMANESADITYRDEDDFQPSDFDETIDQRVYDKYMQHQGSIIPAYLAIKNPFVLGGPNETQFDEKQRDRLVDSIRRVGKNFLNVDASKVKRTMLSYYDEDEITSAENLIHAVHNSPGMLDAIEPESGMEASPEVMRAALQDMGYDGIIDTRAGQRFSGLDGINENTTHYIAFEPNQVKSVNNSGAFNNDDARFMFSSVKPAYSANATMGQRVPQQAPKDRLAEIEAATTYNNIAPVLERILKGVKVKGKGVGLSEERAKRVSEGTVFALQDVMQPLGKLIDRVRANGGTISDASDPYLRQQLMSGKIEDQTIKAQKNVYNPLLHAVRDLNVTKADMDDLLKRHPSNMVNVNGVPIEKSSVRGILSNYTDPKLGLAEVYLYAQHAKERNAVMRERNARVAGDRPEQYDAGSGMSDHEADQVLRWFGSKKFGNEFSDLSNPNSIRSRFRKLIGYTNDVRVAGGLNPDFRTMKDANGDPVDRYQDYAPLRGHLETSPDYQDEISNIFAKTGKRLNISGKEDRSALGRASQGANLIANAVLQNEEAIYRAEKNKVGNAFLNMVNDNKAVWLSNGPNAAPQSMDDFAEVVPLTKKTYIYDKNSGLVRPQNTPVTRDPDIMIVKRNGNDVAIKIADPRLRAAMLGNSMLGAGGQHAVVNGLLKLNRFLAAVRTSYNPEFLVSNFFRDFSTAELNLSELEMKGLRTGVLKDTPGAIRGVFKGIRDSKPNAWSREFEDFAAHGAKTAYMGMRDLENTMKRSLEEITTDHGSNWEKTKDGIKAVGRFTEAMNDAVENGVRVATYKQVRDRLLALSKNPTDPKEIERIKNRAAYVAKNLTVNFNMGGSQKPILNSLYLFFNASIQGSAALLNPMIRSKKVRRLWLGAVAGGLLQDAIMSSLAAIAPDGENEYDKIPDYVLQTNMIFMNPFADNGYIKIPMPYLFNSAWNSGRAIMRMMRGGYTPGETMNSVMGTLVDGINPWGGGGSFLNFVAPTVVDPIVDLYTNRDFSGKPIAPEKDQYSAVDLPAQRYWNNTSPIYTTVAKVLDRLTGGDGTFKGAFSFSPNQYQYVMDYLGGGATSTLVRAFDMVTPSGPAASALRGDPVSANDIPFARRFLGNLTPREDLSKFIENRDKVEAVRQSMKEALKEGDTQRYQDIIQKYPVEYKAAAKITAIDNRRKKISSTIKKINGNNRLTSEEKQKLVAPLKKQQEALVNQGNAFMNAQ